MKKIFLIVWLLFGLMGVGRLFCADGEAEFNRGIAYYLAGDTGLAGTHLNKFFREGNSPKLQGGFQLLVKGDKNGATNQFKNYLDLDHRSPIGVVGIALATAERKVTNTRELLKRAIGLDRRFASAYLAQGVEFKKIKNYPEAERYMRHALSLTGLPEFKILLGQLYLERGRNATVLSLLKGEADKAPGNFFYNFLTAKACYNLGRVHEMGTYIQNALDVKPKNQEAKLLTAKFYLVDNNPQKAKLILSSLKFDGYHQEYSKTYANILVKLKDKKADKHLFDVFAGNKWESGINRLMGIYYLGVGKGGNVQNWIYRSLLCGVDMDKLKAVFTEKYSYPLYLNVPFFNVKKIIWVSPETVMVMAVQRSGQRERVYLVDLKKAKVLRSFAYSGQLLEVFQAPTGGAILFSTKAGNRVYLYSMQISDGKVKQKGLWGRTVKAPAVSVGFNSAGSLAYITDSRVETLPFVSPFSIVGDLGEKDHVYAKYPFILCKFNFVTGSFRYLNEAALENVPIDAVRKYMAIRNAISSTPFQSVTAPAIEKGEALEISSSETVRIHFSRDLNSFILAKSDLNNAFKGPVCDNAHRDIKIADDQMFLGKGKFVEVALLDFNPSQRELILLTKDESKTLIIYNYDSQLFTTVTSNVYRYHLDTAHEKLYLITLGNVNAGKPLTKLHVVSLRPYLHVKVPTRRGLTDIVSIDRDRNVYFSTFDGELVRMDYEYAFTYVKPSLDGCLSARSPFDGKTAAFINGRLVIIP